MSFALPVAGGGGGGGGGGAEPLPLAGGVDVDPEEPPDEVVGLPVGSKAADPELPVAVGGLPVALEEGALDAEPFPQPDRISTATARPQNVFRGPM